MPSSNNSNLGRALFLIFCLFVCQLVVLSGMAALVVLLLADVGQQPTGPENPPKSTRCQAPKYQSVSTQTSRPASPFITPAGPFNEHQSAANMSVQSSEQNSLEIQSMTDEDMCTPLMENLNLNDHQPSLHVAGRNDLVVSQNVTDGEAPALLVDDGGDHPAEARNTTRAEVAAQDESDIAEDDWELLADEADDQADQPRRSQRDGLFTGTGFNKPC